LSPAAQLQSFGIDANQELAKQLADGSLRLALVAEGLEAIGAGPDRFVIYLGASSDDPVMTATTNALGEPLYQTSTAEWFGDRTLRVGESTLTLPYRFGMTDAPLAIERASLHFTGIELTPDGLSFDEGVLSGVLYRADLDRWLYRLRAWCATDPSAPASTCGYAQMADMPLIETFLTWDVERPDCNKWAWLYGGDPMLVVGAEVDCLAVSICLRLSGEAGSVAAPADGPSVLQLGEPEPLDPRNPDPIYYGPLISCGCRLSASRAATDASALGIALALLLSAALYATARRSPRP